MLRVVRKFKHYEHRQIWIYDNKKIVDILMPWHGWYLETYVAETYKDEIRVIAMQNLYWLLGKDCDQEEWSGKIELWNKGQGSYKVKWGKNPKSLFLSEALKNIALNSFEEKVA